MQRKYLPMSSKQFLSCLYFDEIQLSSKTCKEFTYGPLQTRRSICACDAPITLFFWNLQQTGFCVWEMHAWRISLILQSCRGLIHSRVSNYERTSDSSTYRQLQKPNRVSILVYFTARTIFNITY